jgi:phosphoesterase RecJ-like protein
MPDAYTVAVDPAFHAQAERFIARLRAAKYVRIFTHQRPDPDALGSQAAMAILLRRLGVLRVEAVNFVPPPVPPQYLYLQENLEGAAVVEFNPAWPTTLAAGAPDLIVIVDTCAFNQLEPATDYLRASRDRIIVLDHHLSRDDLSDLIFADTDAAAAVELVWYLARHLAKLPMDPPLALPLLSGLVADTGWFRFDSVRPLTHQMAADLTPFVEASVLYERLQQNETAPKLALIQRALANIVWLDNQRAAVLVLSNQDFAAAGATQAQTEELVNLPLMVGSVEVCALLSETPEGRVRASLRSKHFVDVNQLARQFGGGGHAKAAGLRLEGPLPAARDRLCAAITQALRQAPSGGGEVSQGGRVSLPT